LSGPLLLVAITRLATSIELEAKALAADLGGVVYDQRGKLNAGMPAVVLTTSDAAAADLCLARLHARGHEAMLVSSDDVVRADAMLAMKRFAFEDAAATGPYRGQGAGLIANDSERRPWEEITALVRATHRSLGQATSVVTEKKFDAMRAVVTGGLLTSKKVQKNVTTHAPEHEEVLYIFGLPGTTPWFLRERHAHYGTLGAALTLSSHENFRLSVEAIRERAPRALYDDRLVARRSSPAEDDVLAHIIALA
jgi:hypothetical protein